MELQDYQIQKILFAIVVGVAMLVSGWGEPVNAEQRQGQNYTPSLLLDRVKHHTVDNDGVNIHYVTVGEGPVLLFVHGAPDFWYLWYHQMNDLCDDYQCVAMDTRGYNRSDKPKGMKNYDMDFLMSDVNAVIEDVGAEKVTLIGHDFGGLISWYFVMDERYRSKVHRLINMNITHPRGFSRALANQTPEQAKDTAYARILIDPVQEESSVKLLTGAINLRMKTWWNDQDPRIVEFVNQANERTSPVSITQYYQANYFKEPYVELTEFPKIQVPVLQLHGLADMAVSPDGLAETWDWVEGEYTLVTFPGIGHIPQLQIPDRVTQTIRGWLRTQ